MIIKLDLCVTLRCNAYCINCIRFCNMKKVTGLDYSDSDMTMAQIDNFVDEIKGHEGRVLIRSLNVSGGEPLLHPQLSEIIDRLEELRGYGFVRTLTINSNLLLPVPDALQKYIIHYVKMKNRPRRHQAVLLHPNDFGGANRAYKECTHGRKTTWVLTYQGYSMCCAADGYIRLFGMEDLLFDKLPIGISEQMDKVCWHCPFGSEDILPYEIDVCCPVSDIYEEEAEKNHSGRTIIKRFPERSSV